MIVIPMLGRSSRFFNEGYTLPKYQLPLAGETVFAKSLRSFERQFAQETFLFLVRNDYHALQFVAREICRLGIKDYRILEVAHDTRGQADSVSIGIRDYRDDVPILIFNIDTIRHDFEFPSHEHCGDGFLEVFEGEGDNWSFIEAGKGSRVLRTTEKKRISDLCCNGIYGFSRAADFNEALQAYIASEENVGGEIYVAPLYNYLIKKGCEINFRFVKSSIIDHCGIPEDYERLRAKHGDYAR